MLASEKSDAASVDENSDALADMIAAVPLEPHINPVNGECGKGDGQRVIWQRAQLLIHCKIQNQSAQIWPLKMANYPVKPLAICQKLALGPMQGLRQGPMAQTVPMTPPNSM